LVALCVHPCCAWLCHACGPLPGRSIQVTDTSHDAWLLISRTPAQPTCKVCQPLRLASLLHVPLGRRLGRGGTIHMHLTYHISHVTCMSHLTSQSIVTCICPSHVTSYVSCVQAAALCAAAWHAWSAAACCCSLASEPSSGGVKQRQACFLAAYTHVTPCPRATNTSTGGQMQYSSCAAIHTSIMLFSTRYMCLQPTLGFERPSSAWQGRQQRMTPWHWPPLFEDYL
jgi:hypothetical protein